MGTYLGEFEVFCQYYYDLLEMKHERLKWWQLIRRYGINQEIEFIYPLIAANERLLNLKIKKN